MLEEVRGKLHYTFPMRTDTGPFNDRNVRLALKHAIDREAFLPRRLLQEIRRREAGDAAAEDRDPGRAPHAREAAGALASPSSIDRVMEARAAMKAGRALSDLVRRSFTPFSSATRRQRMSRS